MLGRAHWPRSSAKARGTDVAIWGITNPRAGLTLKRIAEACVEAGLRTTILWWKMAGRAGLTPQFYDVAGVTFREVTMRRDFGPLRYGRHLGLPLLMPGVRSVLRQLNPGCVLTQLDHLGVDRVWQHAARLAGIPGVVVQEGMANVPKVRPTPSSKRALRRWTWGKRDLLDRFTQSIPHPLFEPSAPYMFAEYACVWGEAMRRHLVSLGRDERTVFITGSPAFDDLTGRGGPAGDGGSYVLYAQQRMGLPLQERMPFYEHAIEIVTKQLGFPLVFKMHPNCARETQAIRDLAERLDCPPALLDIVDQGDAVDLLANARVAVVATSTTAYHALVSRVPLVVLDYYSDQIRFDPGDSGGVAVVADPAELEETLRRAIHDAAFRDRLRRNGERVIRDHLFELDGGAAGRVASVLSSLTTADNLHPRP